MLSETSKIPEPIYCVISTEGKKEKKKIETSYLQVWGLEVIFIFFFIFKF